MWALAHVLMRRQFQSMWPGNRGRPPWLSQPCGGNATGAQGLGLLPWEHDVTRAPTPRGQRHEGTNATRAPTPRGLRATDYCHGSTQSRGHQRHGGTGPLATATRGSRPGSFMLPGETFTRRHLRCGRWPTS
jgi:hypothetical protein